MIASSRDQFDDGRQPEDHRPKVLSLIVIIKPPFHADIRLGYKKYRDRMAGQRHSNICLFDHRQKIFTPFVYQLKSTIFDWGRGVARECYFCDHSSFGLPDRRAILKPVVDTEPTHEQVFHEAYPPRASGTIRLEARGCDAHLRRHAGSRRDCLTAQVLVGKPDHIGGPGACGRSATLVLPSAAALAMPSRGSCWPRAARLPDIPRRASGSGPKPRTYRPMKRVHGSRPEGPWSRGQALLN